jgi:tripartite-type tricarboxylate transporter receptor subunit TctC
MFGARKITAESLERTFALNHMSYFVLTHGLRERLHAAAPSRVVTISAVNQKPPRALREHRKSGYCLREILSPRFHRGRTMKLPHRRQFLHLAAGAAALTVVSRIARAQTYPSRPVRIIVGFAPGGAPDIVARLLGPTLSERLGQPIFVENRTGAGSNIATEAVVNSPPDGHTLLLVSPPNFVNASLYEKLNYEFIRDIAPVVALIRVPNVMVVTPSLPVKTVPEFIAYAKANPDKLNMASGGNGTSIHMAGELFKMMTGVRMTHVPYRGVGASYPDLLAGQVQVMFDSTPGSIEFIRSGRLRALGLAALRRSPALPDVATIAEVVPGFETSALHGVGVPRNTPAEVIDRLNREINAVLAQPTIKARLLDMAATILGGTPSDFGKLSIEETEKWARVVRFAGLKAE